MGLLISKEDIEEKAKVTPNYSELFAEFMSDFVRRECGREFEANIFSDELHKVDSGIILVKEPPIRSVTKITLNDSELDSEDYYVEDSEVGGVLLLCNWEPSDLLKITYNGGYETIPGTLKFLLIALARWVWTKFANYEFGVESMSSETKGFVVIVREALPLTLQRMLDYFRI